MISIIFLFEIPILSTFLSLTFVFQLEKELDPHKLKAVKVKIMGEIKELVEGSNGGN